MMISKNQITSSSAHRNLWLVSVEPRDQSSPVARSSPVAAGCVVVPGPVRARSPPPLIARSRHVLGSFAPGSMRWPHGVCSLALVSSGARSPSRQIVRLSHAVLILSRPSRVERAAHHHSSCRRRQGFHRLLKPSQPAMKNPLRVVLAGVCDLLRGPNC